MRRWAKTAIIITFLTKAALASSGTEGAAFLDIPIGGAPAAMGSAYTALATDAYAPVLNPGGLGFLDSTQLAGHHISYLETSSYDFVSFVHPLKAGHSLGASLQYLGSGDMTRRNESGDQIGDYSSHYSAFSLSYGQTVRENLSLGLSGRWINGKIDDVSADSYAADLGALYKVNNRFQTGMTVTNIGKPLKFLESSDPLPLAFHLGAAGLLANRWTVSGEGVYEGNGLLSGRFGTQWQVVPLMALRAGYRTDTLKELSALAGFSTGIGLSLWGSEFAYTWVPYGDLGQTHSFALLLSFGKSAKSRSLIQYNTYHRHNPNGEVTPEDVDNLTTLLESASRERTAALGAEEKP